MLAERDKCCGKWLRSGTAVHNQTEASRLFSRLNEREQAIYLIRLRALANRRSPEPAPQEKAD